MEIKVYCNKNHVIFDILNNMSVSHSVMSDSLQPHGLQPSRLLCPWNSQGKNTGVGSHSFLQGVFLTQGLNIQVSCIAGRFFTIRATRKVRVNFYCKIVMCCIFFQYKIFMMSVLDFSYIHFSESWRKVLRNLEKGMLQFKFLHWKEKYWLIIQKVNGEEAHNPAN